MSVAEIARRVNLSQTPIARRIQRMEERGLIRRRVTLLDPVKVGAALTAFVEIRAPDHGAGWFASFRDEILAMPEVMELHRLSGEVDYLLRVAVRDMAAYGAFYTRLTERVPARQVTTRFSIERVKETTAYPLDALIVTAE